MGYITVELIITIGSLLTALGIIALSWRKIANKYRAFKKHVQSVADAITGREAILNPDTGEEVLPAVPGINTRVARLEESHVGLADAFAKLVDVQESMVELDARIEDTFQEFKADKEEQHTKIWAAIGELRGEVNAE